MTTPEGKRYRLEIKGRAGWFVPAFEAVMPRGMARNEVTKRMASAMAAYGPVYVADEAKGESYDLRAIERRELGFCKSGTCKSRRF